MLLSRLQAVYEVDVLEVRPGSQLLLAHTDM